MCSRCSVQEPGQIWAKVRNKQTDFSRWSKKTNISQRSKRSEFAKFVKSPETNFINLKVFKCDIYFPHRKTCKRQKSSKESIPGDEITVVMSSSLSEVSLLNQLNKTTWVNSSNTMTQKDTYQATTEADFTQWDLQQLLLFIMWTFVILILLAVMSNKNKDTDLDSYS